MSGPSSAASSMYTFLTKRQVSSDEEGSMNDVKPALGDRGGATGRGTSLKGGGEGGPPACKKTKGRVKIKMEFIDNKLRRYTTFSKRKTGIMKKVSKFFKALTNVRALKVHTCTQNSGLEPPFTGSYPLSRIESRQGRVPERGTTP